MRIFLLLIFFGFSPFLFAQETDLDNLNFYGDAMSNTYHPKNRVIAFNSFYPLLKKVLDQSGSYDINLDSISGVKVLHEDNGSFRLISWQLEEETDYKYFAFLQDKSGKVYEFVQNNEDLGIDFSYYIHAPEDWYGSIYYQIKPEITNDGIVHYLLYGFKRINSFKKAKIVDVLSFDEQGVPMLGKEIFIKPVKDSRDDVHSKILLTYDANAHVDIKYNEHLDFLIYDHLITKMGDMPGQGMTKYPDGTYEGYKKESGKYIYTEKIFDQINETVPREKKVRKKQKLFPEKTKK